MIGVAASWNTHALPRHAQTILLVAAMRGHLGAPGSPASRDADTLPVQAIWGTIAFIVRLKRKKQPIVLPTLSSRHQLQSSPGSSE
jgi:hypothetical protein